MKHHDRWLGNTRMRPIPMPRPPVVLAITSLAADAVRRFKTDAARRKLDAVMCQISEIRARRECSEADLDHAASAYARAALAIVTGRMT
jgi:hypothetical protein